MSFTVDTEKARKEASELREKIQSEKVSREEILEEEFLEFAIGEMEIFDKCSIHALSQYKLMTSKELKEFVSKFSKKGIFKGIQ